MQIKKYAAIDIGSNAIRLLINNLIVQDGNKLYKKVDIIRVPIRLGTDAFISQSISKENLDRLINAMNAFSYLMKVHQVENFRACATSALREIKNNQEIISIIKSQTGIPIEIISGEEEAAIIYSTHISQLKYHDDSFLFVDVGGGSAELTLFENQKIVDSKSFDVGTIRLLNDLVTDQVWLEMQAWVRKLTEEKNVFLLGSGGNINKVFKLSRKPKNEALTLDYLENYLEGIKNYSYEERVTKLDMNVDRADVIVPALEIFTSIMKWSNASQIYVPKIGLADGIIKLMN